MRLRRRPWAGNHKAELKRLDAGKGEQIPTLEDVCREVHGRSGLFVELKEPGSEAIIARVLKLHGPEMPWIIPFHAECIAAVKGLCPGVRTGLIFSRPITDPVVMAVNLGVQAILPKFGIVTLDLVRGAHNSGMKVISWTLNTPDAFAAAMAYEIDGLATDDPCRARNFWRKNLHSLIDHEQLWLPDGSFLSSLTLSGKHENRMNMIASDHASPEMRTCYGINPKTRRVANLSCRLTTIIQPVTGIGISFQVRIPRLRSGSG